MDRLGSVKSMDVVVLLVTLAATVIFVLREYVYEDRSVPPFAVIQEDESVLTAIAFTPDSRQLLIARADGTLKLAFIDSNSRPKTLRLPYSVTALAADSMAERFVVGCNNGRLYVIDRYLKTEPYNLALLDEKLRDVTPVSPLRYYTEQAFGTRLTPATEVLNEFAFSSNLVGVRHKLAMPQLVPRRSARIETLCFVKRDFVVAATDDGLYHIVYLKNERSLPAFGCPTFINNPMSGYKAPAPDQLRHRISLLALNGTTAFEYKAGYRSYEVWKWNTVNHKAEQIYRGTYDDAEDPYGFLAASPDGDTVVFAKNRELFRLSSEEATRFLSFPYSPSSIELSKGGDYLVTAGITEFAGTVPQSVISLWNMNSGKLVFELRNLPFLIDDVSISPDKSKIAATCGDNAVRMWASGISSRPSAHCRLLDVRFAKESYSLGEVVHVQAQTNGARNRDAILQYSLDDGSTWTSLIELDGHLLHRLPSGENKIRFRLFEADWHTTSSLPKNVYVRDDGILEWAEVDDPGKMGLGLVGAGFDSTGRMLYSLDKRAVFRQRDGATGKVILEKKLDFDTVCCCDFNPTGTRLAFAAGTLDEIKLFQLSESVTQIPVQFRWREFFCFVLDENGQRIAAIDIYSDEVQIWRCDSNSSEPEITFKTGRPAAFSSSGEYVVCSGANGFEVRSVRNGSIVATVASVGIRYFVKPVGVDAVMLVWQDRIETYGLPNLNLRWSVAISQSIPKASAATASADCRRVALGTEGGVVFLIEIVGQTAAKVFRIDAHREAINVLAMDRSGRWLFSASTKEGKSKMWDADAISNAGLAGSDGLVMK